ncbi:MAG: Holliday junction branch migration protein RuvA [Flavobacteriaceae bacterium]|nr:MAG: Holliday junction branch migration protein RuvA [Flavobacteriaceae bacterium]
MISHLRGKQIELCPTSVVVECGGVGYKALISLTTFSDLENNPQEFPLLYTELIVREDSQKLYGFSTTKERSLFVNLLSVSGVGPASAIVMLSSISAEKIRQAIVEEDVKTLQGIKGIGLKTAQKIVIDLRDKMLKNWEGSQEITQELGGNKIEEQAVLALETLGIATKMAQKVIGGILEKNTDISLEVLLKEALRKL